MIRRYIVVAVSELDGRQLAEVSRHWTRAGAARAARRWQRPGPAPLVRYTVRPTDRQDHP